MHGYMMILLLFTLSLLSSGRTEILARCQELDDAGDLDEHSLFKLRRVRALCDILQSSRSTIEQEDVESIPNFDLNQIDTGNVESIEREEVKDLCF